MSGFSTGEAGDLGRELAEMPVKLKLEVEERLAANAAALYLEMLAAGLRKGSGRFVSRHSAVEFDLPTEVDFELEVKLDSAKAEGKIEIEVAWSLDENAQTDGLRISSDH
jgi:amphi-Trp domain-containing protein